MNPHAWVVGDDISIAHRRRIDGGAFGQVHELFNKHTGQVFARKVLIVGEYGPGTATHSDIRKEIRAVTKLCISNTHRNIVAVFKIGSRMNPTFYFIDMELCDFNLDVYIRRNFPQHLRGRVRQFLEVEKLTVEEKRGQILGVLRDIIAGVEYIHSEGEIHRDLKPQNVLYSCRDSAWKIADFGFATEGSSERMYISRYGRGTPGYRAPELEFFVSISRFNNKVDIWALGCILYEIVFKQRPFQNQYEVKDFADGRKSLKFPDSRGICDDSKLGKFTLEVLHLDPGKRPGIKELLVGIEEVFAPVERKPREIVAKGNEIRQRHPPPGGIRGLNQELFAISEEDRAPERPVHPLFRKKQRLTPQIATLATTSVVTSTAPLRTNCGLKPQPEGQQMETVRRPNGTDQDINRPGTQLMQRHGMPRGSGNVSPSRKTRDTVPGSTPTPLGTEIRGNTSEPHSPRILESIHAAETIAKEGHVGVVPQKTAFAPQIAMVVPRATSSIPPVEKHQKEHISVSAMEVTTTRPISDYRETSDLTGQGLQTPKLVEQKHGGQDKVPQDERRPLATILEINSNRSHPANKDRDQDAPQFPPQPVGANGNLPLNLPRHTREPSLYGDGNSEPRPSINEEPRISPSPSVNNLTHQIAQDGSIERISVPGDEETGTLEIDFVEHVVVNESNTHIGALVVTKKSSRSPYTTQLRLWEAHSGKLVWHRNLVCDAETTCRPSFTTDGNYFCYQDGHARLMTLDIMTLREQIRLKLPVKQDSGMGAFEWNLTTHGVKAFTIHSSLERVALAVPETSLEQIKVTSVVNKYFPSEMVKHIDQIHAPHNPEFAVQFPTELYYTAKRHLFMAWHDTKKVVIACFDFVTGLVVSQIEYPWNTPREFVHGFNVSGVLSLGGEDCAIVTVPSAVQHPILTNRFRAPAIRRKTMIVAASGREIATLMMSEVGPSEQRREIIISNRKVIRCCWTEVKGTIEIWSQNRFSTACRFTFAEKAPAVGSKVAYDRGKLSLLSPDGKFQFLVPTRKG